MADHNRVIVIGSGVSGLACARELVHRGYEVLVVEARGRVGGRLKGEPLQLEQQQEEEHTVDLGGALIHGIDQNPIHSITTQMGVPLHEVSDYCLLMDENGWPFDPKLDEKLSSLFNECLDITFQRISEKKNSGAPTTSNDDVSVNDNFGDLFDRVCREKGVKHATHPLFKWHQANLELPTGADFHELGYTWNDDEPYGFTGAHAAIEPSWKFVMEYLADGLDILYHSAVTRIQVVLPDGSTPTSCPGPPSSDAMTVGEDEETKPDDEELPSPVKITTRTEWRSASRTPDPSPSRRSRRIRGEDVKLRRSHRSTKGLIQKLTVGHNKGIFSYDDPSKKPKSSNRNLKSNGKNGDEELPGSTVQVTLQNGTVLKANAVVCTLPLGILKVPPKEPGHVHFVPPLPANKCTAIQQLGCGLLNKCALSFPTVFWQDSDFLGLAKKTHSYLVLNVTKYTGMPILIFMYGGSSAKELESWTDAAIVEDCLMVLKRICGKEVPAPVDYCVTRWGMEQYSRMAFTYIPPGVDGHSQLVAAGEPIHDPAMPERPLVMFAGEHTTPYHPSTMHGAFLSGIREAYRYDIFLAPELNGNMEFETDHKIYEHTFTTKRVYGGHRHAKKPKQETAQTNPSSSQIRSRRRRFANMALRKSPTKRVLADIGSPPPDPKLTADAATPEIVSSRRSQRSLSSKKAPELLESPGETESQVELEMDQKQSLNALEDRLLRRALESYGRNCGLTRSKVVPVYGATRKRSADQIRQRWQQLTTARNKRKKSDKISKQWQANAVAAAISLPDHGFETTKGENEDNGNVKWRRSRRQTRPKVMPDV